MEKQIQQDEQSSVVKLTSENEELKDLLTTAEKKSGFYIDNKDLITDTFNATGGVMTLKDLIDNAKRVMKNEGVAEDTIEVNIGELRQNILEDPNLAQRLDVGEPLEVPPEVGDDEQKVDEVEETEQLDGEQYEEADPEMDAPELNDPDLGEPEDVLDEGGDFILNNEEEELGNLVADETGGSGFGEGVEMTEMGIDAAIDGASEVQIGAFLPEEVAGETAAELGTELGEELGGEVAATTATGLLAGGLIAAGVEVGTAATIVGGGAALLASTGPLIIAGAAGYMLYKLIDDYTKEQKEQETITSEDAKRLAIRDGKYKSREERNKAWDDYFNPEKNPSAMIYLPEKNTFPPSGKYYNMKELYPHLKKYVDGMNKVIDQMNKKSNLYQKWVGSGYYKYDDKGKIKFLNDPDQYSRGEAEHGVYKKMPKMSVGALLSTKGYSIQERMANWQHQFLQTPGSNGATINGGANNLIMADPYMLNHYQQQSENDPGYEDALNEAFIDYKIKQNSGQVMNPDYGDITTPAELETVNPPFWARYYTLNQNKFSKQDTAMIKESMKQYIARKGKPTYTYKKPQMTPQQRFRWDRAFNKHKGGLVLIDKKTGRRITRETLDDKNFDKKYPPTAFDKAREKRKKIPHTVDPCNRTVRGRRLGDPECKRVPSDGADKKHEHKDSKPVQPILPHDQSNDYSFHETKEWALQRESVSFDPNLAEHLLGLAELSYDIPVVYNSFDEVPPSYNLQTYKVKEYLGRQENQTPFSMGFLYNSFGLMFYDEAESRIVIAIEGTDFPEITTNPSKFMSDVLVDLDTGLVQVDNLKFHRGMFHMASDVYNQALDFIRRHIQPELGTTITFCGHSLGGGVANILAYLVSKEIPTEAIRLYTFGAPRCMDAASAEIFSNQIRHHYRVTLEYDVITYLPPKLEGDRDGYTHAGMNIQYTARGKMHEILGRDEQLIFRSTIGATIAVLLLMAFMGNMTHTLETVGLGASYTPEGSTVITYLKDTFRNYLNLPRTLQQSANALFENLGNLISNQQLNPNSTLNFILQQRAGIVRRFANSYNINQLEFNHIVTESMLTNATEQQFLDRISYLSIPTTQSRNFYQTMQATSINMFEHFSPTNTVAQRIYNTIFPTASSFMYYLQTIAVGKGVYNIVNLMKTSISKPLDTHGRSSYRRAIEGGLNFYHHVGHSVMNEQKFTDPYDNMFAGNEAYEKLHTNCKLPTGHGRKLSNIHCRLPEHIKKNVYHSNGNYYLPSYHKGQVYMNVIPEQYILGLYFYDEDEFVNRHDLLGFAVF